MKDKSKKLVVGNEDEKIEVEATEIENKNSVVERSVEEESSIDEFDAILKTSVNTYSHDNILSRYYDEVGQYPLLTVEEERQCAYAVKEGCMDSWNRLFMGNMRLAIMVAHRYKNQGVDTSDLISEANLGIMHAISKFEPDKGFRFSTYAVWWIRHYLSNVIMNEGRTIRIPIHVNKAISRQQMIIKELTQTLDREPTIKEIADKSGQSIFEVMSLISHHESTLSLDASINQQEGGDFYHIVSDDNAEDVPEVLIGSEKLSILASFLHLLEPQARKVIEYRFGVNGESPQTLEKTGKLLGITRDQVRYSQMKALEALRNIFEEKGIYLSDILK